MIYLTVAHINQQIVNLCQRLIITVCQDSNYNIPGTLSKRNKNQAVGHEPQLEWILKCYAKLTFNLNASALKSELNP